MFYLGPGDFHGGELTLDLFPGPGHRTLIVVVPALTAASSQHDKAIPIIAHAATADRNAEPTQGHALPELEKLPFTPAKVPPPGAAHLAKSRRVAIFASKSKTYSPVSAQLAYTGNRYAFYRDPANKKDFTKAEYAAISGKLDAAYPELVGIFGPVTDLDHNGRIAVLVSRTIGQVQTGGEASIDGCNFEAGNPHCKPGEVIHFASLGEMLDDHLSRDELVQSFYPRNILHETIHLTQEAAAYRAGKLRNLEHTPHLYREGPAELLRYKDDLGERNKWRNVHQALRRGGTPAEKVYPLGGLLFWWADVAFGDGVQRALLRAELDGSGDPFATAVHIPEPLVLAMMYAALQLDGTSLGRSSHLDFPHHDIAKLGGTPPVQPLEAGHNAPGVASWTGATTFEARHAGPLRVRLDVAGAGAYVLVAQL